MRSLEEATGPSSAETIVPGSAVYDHKTNTTRYDYMSAQGEFIGTSAKSQSLATAKPS